MNDFFVYGTLRHKPLLDLVAGAPVEAIPARISGFAVYWAAGESFPMITAEEGGQAEGLLLRNLSGIQRDRLDYERLVVTRLQLISDLQFYYSTETPALALGSFESLTGEAK